MPCPPKWAAVPRLIPENAQWGVHHINGGPEAANVEGLTYRHFRQINTSWKYRRDALPGNVTVAALVKDMALEAALLMA